MMLSAYPQAIVDTLISWPLPFKAFKAEFTIVIFIHYKPPIAIAILDL